MRKAGHEVIAVAANGLVAGLSSSEASPIAAMFQLEYFCNITI